MSIVLDALRRADRERREAMPATGLPDAPWEPVASTPTAAPPRSARRVPRWLAAAGLLAALAVSGWAWRTTAVTPPLAAPPTPAPPPPAPAPTEPGSSSAPRRADLPTPAHTEPAARADRSDAPRALPPLPAAAPTLRPATAGGTRASGAASAPIETVLPDRIPSEWRVRLASWKFGGALDSPEAARRMLIIDGQLYHEGDEPAPGLRIVRIRLRSAVFESRGQTFEWSY